MYFYLKVSFLIYYSHNIANNKVFFNGNLIDFFPKYLKSGWHNLFIIILYIIHYLQPIFSLLNLMNNG